MPIERGVEWGSAGTLGPDDPVAETDAALRSIVEPLVLASIDGHGALSGGPVVRVGLLGGDLCRTVGGRGDARRLYSDGQVLPCDAVLLELDGRRVVAVAHAVARRSRWFGRVIALMNATAYGSWDVAPRGHPGDGRVDIVDANLSFGDRWRARQRLPLGTHVPHPDIDIRRAASVDLQVDGRLTVEVDRVVEGRPKRIEAWVCPDAFEAVV